jgi:hypothetical protein
MQQDDVTSLLTKIRGIHRQKDGQICSKAISETPFIFLNKETRIISIK